MKTGYSDSPKGNGLFPYSIDSGPETPGAMSYNQQLSSYNKANAPRVNDGKNSKK
jgi:hypothetical protein